MTFSRDLVVKKSGFVDFPPKKETAEMTNY